MKKRKKNTKYELFARLCLDILRKPGGNAGIERMFNPVRVIHTWTRNKMGKEILDDIIYIYVNYRCLKKLGVL